MRYAPRAILAGGLGFAVSLVAACGGSSGLLSSDQSNGLSGQADEIAAAVQSGNCGAAVNGSLALNRDVQTLPLSVNPTLRRNLSQGASTIAELAAKDCHAQTSAAKSAPTTSSTSTTTSTSTPTSTTTSTTTPTTSTTTTSSTTTTATTPTDTGTTSTTGGVGLGGGTTTGNGNGNGNGSGNGNSGGAGPSSPNSSGTGGTG